MPEKHRHREGLEHAAGEVRRYLASLGTALRELRKQVSAKLKSSKEFVDGHSLREAVDIIKKQQRFSNDTAYSRTTIAINLVLRNALDIPLSDTKDGHFLQGSTISKLMTWADTLEEEDVVGIVFGSENMTQKRKPTSEQLLFIESALTNLGLFSHELSSPELPVAELPELEEHILTDAKEVAVSMPKLYRGLSNHRLNRIVGDWIIRRTSTIDGGNYVQSWMSIKQEIYKGEEVYTFVEHRIGPLDSDGTPEWNIEFKGFAFGNIENDTVNLLGVAKRTVENGAADSDIDTSEHRFEAWNLFLDDDHDHIGAISLSTLLNVGVDYPSLPMSSCAYLERVAVNKLNLPKEWDKLNAAEKMKHLECGTFSVDLPQKDELTNAYKEFEQKHKDLLSASSIPNFFFNVIDHRVKVLIPHRKHKV